MNMYQAWARGLIPLLLTCLLLFANEEASAQNFRLHCDGVSALGGVASAARGTLLAVGGQPHPIGGSASANYFIVPGFIPCLTPRAACTGLAVASANAPAAPAEGSQIQVRLFIDMSGIPAPDSLLGSFTGSLIWNPALMRYLSHSGLQAGFTGVINASNAGTGLLQFNGANAAGVAAIVPILAVNFEVIGAAGSDGAFDLNYTDIFSAVTFRNFLPCLAANDLPFRIRPASPCLVCGDVNSDSTANSSDALIILSYDVGIPIPQAFLDKINAGCGDVNTDAATNSFDALIILSFDAGLPVPFSVGNPGGCSTLSADMQAGTSGLLKNKAREKRSAN
jgi:hypothetical protein